MSSGTCCDNNGATGCPCICHQRSAETTYPADAVRTAYQRGRAEAIKEANINGARSALMLYGYHLSREQLEGLWEDSHTNEWQARPLHS
jgi:hypothetical protein